MSVSTQYNRQCLVEYEKFDKKEKVAAVLDYVGATRGQKGQVKFDGNLSGEERSYVESKFGQLSDLSRSGIKQYLTHANKIYFSDLAKKFESQNPGVSSGSYYFKQGSKNCPENMFALKPHNNPNLGQGFALEGLHRCSDNYAGLYQSHPELELAIAANSASTIFFIEGEDYLKEYERRTGKKSFEIFEKQFMDRIADELKIPKKEATPYRTSSPETVRVAIQQSPREEEAYYGAILVKQFSKSKVPVINALINQAKEQGRQLRVDQLNWDIMWNEVIDSTVKTQGVSKDKLVKALYQFLGHNSSLAGKEKIPFNINHIRTDSVNRRVNLYWNKLTETSNRLSIEKVHLQLAESGKSQAVFMVGYLHSGLVRGVYESLPINKSPELSEEAKQAALQSAMQVGTAMTDAFGGALFTVMSASVSPFVNQLRPVGK